MKNLGLSLTWKSQKLMWKNIFMAKLFSFVGHERRLLKKKLKNPKLLQTTYAMTTLFQKRKFFSSKTKLMSQLSGFLRIWKIVWKIDPRYCKDLALVIGSRL